MKLLKWLSVTDRFAKTYLDSKLALSASTAANTCIFSSLCDQPGILQDSLLSIFMSTPAILYAQYLLWKKRILDQRGI